jgi:hypothetical protein
MSAIPQIWTPSRRLVAPKQICPECGRLLRRAGGALVDKARRLRASFGALFSQGGYVSNAGEYVKPLAAIVGDTADCGVCPCGGGSGSSETCSCDTCSSSTDPRAVHLMGFDGSGACMLLPTGFNYFKITGTLDVSLDVPLSHFSVGDPLSDPPAQCFYDWADDYVDSAHSFRGIVTGLTISYFYDAACTIPATVGGGVTSNPFWLTNIEFEYSCGNFDESNGTFGNSGWTLAFRITDNHFFARFIQMQIIPSPVACNDTITLHADETLYTAGLAPPAQLFAAGDAIVAAA